jgi:hypothetical protein
MPRLYGYDAQEIARYPMPDETISHTQVRIGDSIDLPPAATSVLLR